MIEKKRDWNSLIYVMNIHKLLTRYKDLFLGTESLLVCYFMYLNYFEIFKHV